VIGAVLAALAGAFCYAVAAALQQHEAVRTTTRGIANPAMLWQLAHRPWWLAAIAAQGLGASLHLLALSFGPLTFVQPLGVTTLLFAVPLAALLHHHRVQLAELAAALIVLTGLALLLSVLPPGTGAGAVDAEPVSIMIVAAIALTATAVALAKVISGRLRSLLLASGAGISFGVTSALARVVLQTVGQPGSTVTVLFAGAGIALLAPLGFLLVQSAYRAAGFAAALATVTVVDPIAATVGGVLLLHEPLPATPGQSLAMALGAVLATIGIVVLARSPVHGPTAAGDRAAQPGASDAAPSWRTAASVPADGHDQNPMADYVRVLIGTDTYRPDVNAAAYFTYRLATGLAVRGHDVHVVCPSADGTEGTRVEDGVTVHRLRSWRTPMHPTFRVCLPPVVGSAVGAVLHGVAPDVVHVQGHFLIGRALLRAAHRRRLPVVGTNHFMPDNLLGYAHVPAPVHRLVRDLGWWDFTRVFNQADQITTPTPVAADLIRGIGLHPPIRAISCGIDPARFHAPAPGGRAAFAAHVFGLSDRATLLFVGRLDEEKHLHELVAALPTVRRHVDAQLVLVGTGTQYQRLAALARQLGVAADVHFLGFVPDADLPRVYAAADVFAIPGVAELQSLATLEAMASGLPVLAVDAMALPHLVHPGVNGYLYPPGDIATLASRAVALLSCPTLRRRMGRASRQIASGHDADATFAQFEALYAQLRTPAPRPRVTSGSAYRPTVRANR